LKKIAVLTSRFPYPLERGDKLRIYHQIKQLSKHFEVVLIALTDKNTTSEHIAALSDFAKIYTIKISNFEKGVNLVKGWLKGLPLSVANFTNENYQQEVNYILQKEKPTVLYCQLIRMAEYTKGFEGKKILDYQDAFSENMRRRASKANFLLRILFQHEAKRLAEYEAKSYHFFQNHFIISETDKEALTFVEKTNIIICQNGIDTDFFQANLAVRKKYDIIFVGNLGYHPNIEAAQFIVNEIVTKLKKYKPDVSILLAGARPTLAVKNLSSENVMVVGWLDDIRDAYNEGKVFVAPLFQGSGQQNKVLETMAMQVPCIATSIVNASTGATENEAILIADTADEFVDKIILLLENKIIYNNIKNSALQFVLNNFSWKKRTQVLLDTINA
jgi:polysaccharide biosynthesis protein PslH